MPDFLIRGLDEDTMKKLKGRAERNHRSLQAEIKDTLERSVPLSHAEALQLSRKLRAKYDHRDLPLPEDLIREDRDR